MPDQSPRPGTPVKVRELKALLDSLPPELDNAYVLLPEGFHSSWNIRYVVDQDYDGDNWVRLECD